MLELSELDVSKLLYARGFLLTRADEVSIPAHWAQVQLGTWNFHYDPVTQVAVSGCTLFFGHAVDLSSGDSQAPAIATAIDETDGIARQDIIDRLVGRFLIVRADGDEVLLQQDAVGLRAVYWADQSREFIAGSHQRLVAEQIAAPRNEFAGDYLSRNKFQVFPGRSTSHAGVVRLLPNTELSSSAKRLNRVYPRVPSAESSVDEVAELMIDTVNAQIDALQKVSDVVVSLSAGLDSRATLALLRPVVDHTTFFTYDLTYREKNYANEHDRDTALALVREFGLTHRMLEISQPLTAGPLASVLVRNTEFSHSRAVAGAYLEQLPPNALHIRSNIYEIGGLSAFRQLGAKEGPMTASKMRYLISNGRSTDQAAIDAFEVYRSTSYFDQAMGLVADGLGLFHWEHRVGAWMPPILHESDIAVDTHILLNARTLLDRMNSLPVADKKSSAVFRRVIFRCWPEIATIPVNGKLITDPS